MVEINSSLAGTMMIQERFFALVAKGFSVESVLIEVLQIPGIVDMAIVKDTLGFRDGEFHIFMN